MNLVRDGIQPPTFPRRAAASGHHERFLLGKDGAAKPLHLLPVVLAGVSASLLLWGVVGCQTPVAVQGAYSTATESISGGVQATTNGVVVDGDYREGATNVGGTITMAK